MVIFYDVAICLFYLGMSIAALFNRRARLWMVGRRGLFAKLENQMANEQAPVLWMHCASLGEFEQGRPLLEAFRQAQPAYKVLVTFFSPSGYEVQKNYQGADYICFLPLDTSWQARRFVRLVRPQVVVWVKYEFWYNHLLALKRAGICTYLTSATFRPKQWFFKSYGQFPRSVLRSFTHLFVQNDESAQLLSTIGVHNVTVNGDTRFDRVRAIAQQDKHFPLVEQFCDNRPCLIAGSSWPKDERVLAIVMQQFPTVKLVVVPHEIDESHLKDLEAKFVDRKSIRYTQAEGQDLRTFDLLIVDTMGMLAALYRYAQVAYIGCGFDDGIHNTLEAAVFGIPIVFGPNYTKFNEARELVAAGGAVSIANDEELNAVLTTWFGDAAIRTQLGQQNADYVRSKSGATTEIIKLIGAQE